MNRPDWSQPVIGTPVWDIDDDVDAPESWSRVVEVLDEGMNTDSIWEVRLEGQEETVFIKYEESHWEVT